MGGTLILLLQIVTENGATQSPEIPFVGETLSFTRTEEMDEWRLSTHGVIGLSGTVDLAAALPYAWRDLDDEDLAGIGDAWVRVKLNLYKFDEVMYSTRFGVFAGVEAPTGDWTERSGGVRLPRRLQLGSGTWDGWVGAAYSIVRDRHRASVELAVQGSTRRDGFTPGPEARLNLAYWFRLYPAQFPGTEEPVEVRGVVELLTTYRWESRAGSGVGDDGWIISLAPGLQVFPGRRVLLQANVVVPVFQDVDDPLGDREWSAGITIRILF